MHTCVYRYMYMYRHMYVYTYMHMANSNANNRHILSVGYLVKHLTLIVIIALI